MNEYIDLGCDFCRTVGNESSNKLKPIKRIKKKDITIFSCPKCNCLWEVKGDKKILTDKETIKQLYNIRVRKVDFKIMIFLYILYVILFFYLWYRYPIVGSIVTFVSIYYYFWSRI